MKKQPYKIDLNKCWKKTEEKLEKNKVRFDSYKQRICGLEEKALKNKFDIDFSISKEKIVEAEKLYKYARSYEDSVVKDKRTLYHFNSTVNRFFHEVNSMQRSFNFLSSKLGQAMLDKEALEETLVEEAK